MQIFGHNVQRPASSKLTAEHRSWDVVEGAAGTGADRDDLRQGAEVDARFGTDEEPFERGHEVGIAQILGDQLSDTAGSRLSDIKDVASHTLQECPVGGKGGLITTDHNGHPWRTAADRRIQYLDASCLTGRG